ncbi:hypothetical protein, partial [Sphingomonas sp. ERG5]|uniref:hypothetical protein n=1 Tax=Sphingomonas sp. ERG5 TaxID=1381597 RepID=UPI00054B308B
LPTLPVQPAPPAAKGNKCGVFGAILLVVIAVAVTVVTAGAAAAALSPTITSIGAGISALAAGSAGLGVTIAAGAIGGALGSIVSQGVGVATGIQEKFNWKGVALGALSGAVGGGVAKLGLFADIGSKFATGALNGALSSAVTQGIGVATGLQSKFDWTGVAAAGIGGGVGAWAGGKLGATSLTDRSFSNIAANLGASAAGGFANAATRSLISGTDFGDNLMAALPDVIGSTIGNLVAGGISGGHEARIKRLLDSPDQEVRDKGIRMLQQDDAKFVAAEDKRLAKQQEAAFSSGDLDTADFIGEQRNDLTTNSAVVGIRVASRAGIIRFGVERASQMTLGETIGASSKALPLSDLRLPVPASDAPKSDSVDGDIVVTARKLGEVTADSTIGRVVVNSLDYTKAKYDGYRATYGPIVDVGVAGVKALLSGGIAPVVQYGANKGVESALPQLPTKYLRPIAEVASEAGKFIGQGGGGILLGTDRQQVNQTDSGGVLFGIEKLIGISAVGISGLALKIYRGTPAKLAPYSEQGGHHPASQAAFRGAEGYDGKAALSVSEAELRRLGVQHKDITKYQSQLYRAFAKDNNTITWGDVRRIEAQSLISAGMKPSTARATVRAAIQQLKASGVSGPTRIPYGGN